MTRGQDQKKKKRLESHGEIPGEFDIKSLNYQRAGLRQGTAATTVPAGGALNWIRQDETDPK